MTHNERLIAWIFDREGGGKFTDLPQDSGGATKWGITFEAWKHYRAKAGAEVLRPAAVRDITEEQAVEFYTDEYIEHPNLRLDLLPLSVALPIFDGAVLFGRARAAKWAQGATGALKQIDGIIGPVSRAALEETPLGRWLGRVQQYRVNRHLERIRAEPDQAVFMNGWINRTLRLVETLDVVVEANRQAAVEEDDDDS